MADRRGKKLQPVGASSARIAGDALAQPTRARLFKTLAENPRPMTTVELAGELGLHPSGVRVHLERLRNAGLVSRESISQTRGRPRYGWQIAPDAGPGGDPPDAYELLARWLARSIPPRPVRLREAQRAGRELGRELVPAMASAPAYERIGRTLTALGFAPRRQSDVRRTTTFTLGNCPYRDAVQENQPVVCALHQGLTRGLLDVIAPSARLADFVPKDPARAGCLIVVKGLEPG